MNERRYFPRRFRNYYPVSLACFNDIAAIAAFEFRCEHQILVPAEAAIFLKQNVNARKSVFTFVVILQYKLCEWQLDHENVDFRMHALHGLIHSLVSRDSHVVFLDYRAP